MKYILLQTTELNSNPWDKIALWFQQTKMFLPNLLFALIVFLLFIFLSRYLRKLITKIYHNKSANPGIATVMASIFTILFIFIGVFVSLSILGLNQTVTSLLAGAGIFGLVLGLALQDTLSSAIAGIIMTHRKSYKVGDFVESNGFMGSIVELNLRNTTVRQTNGVDVKIPNKLVLANPLINFSLTKERRVDITVGVSYDADLDQIKQILSMALKNIPSIQPSKEIEIFFTEFGNNSIEILIRYWISKYKQADYLQAKSEGIVVIKNLFAAHGIEIPLPVYVVEMKGK